MQVSFRFHSQLCSEIILVSLSTCTKIRTWRFHQTKEVSNNFSVSWHITHIPMAISANLGRDTEHNSTKLVRPHPLPQLVWIDAKNGTPPAPVNHDKMFKGWPLQDAPSKLVQSRYNPVWYKTYQKGTHFCLKEMKKLTILSNKCNNAESCAENHIFVGFWE